MHNLRKIKRKRKNKTVNPQQLAQQKLFEISRMQDDQSQVNEADIFVEKLEAKFTKIKPKSVEPKSVRSNQHHQRLHTLNTLNTYIDDFQQRTKLASSNNCYRNFRSFSTQLTGKKPIALINYLIIDRRSNKINLPKHARMDVSMIRRKISERRNKSEESEVLHPSAHESIDQADHIALKTKVNSVMQVKNIKLFNKYACLQNF